MQSRNWTSVGSGPQKESRLLYFGWRGLRLCPEGREFIGHPDQLGQRLSTHFSHHLAAVDLHRRPAQPNSAAICLLRRPALTSVITSHLRGVYLSNLLAVPQKLSRSHGMSRLLGA
jgi:hypothetical protein